MPTRKRIRSTFVQAGGGGGAPPTVGSLLLGPDFGEGSAGSDGKTWTVGVRATQGPITISNTKNVGVNMDLDALALFNSKSIGVTQTQELGYSNSEGVGVNNDLLSVDLEHLKSIGVTKSLLDVGILNDHSAAVHLSGTVVGAPFWVSVTTFSSTTTGTNIVIPAPSGLAVDDILLAFVATNNLGGIAEPADWVIVREQSRDGVTDCRLDCYYKIVVASDLSATDYTFSTASSANWGCIHHIKGVDLVTPVDDHDVTSASVTDPVCPANDTTVVNTLQFAACVQSSATNLTYTPPAGYTERTEQDGQGAAGAHLLDGSTATIYRPGTGSTGTATFNSSAIVAVDSIAMHVALRPGTLTIAS